VALFDAHRVGVHAYVLTEGLRMDPPREDGRRCLDETEVAERGWEPNDRGRWHDPAHSRAVRDSFRERALT
jgi:hypothetical protein